MKSISLFIWWLKILLPCKKLFDSIKSLVYLSALFAEGFKKFHLFITRQVFILQNQITLLTFLVNNEFTCLQMNTTNQQTTENVEVRLAKVIPTKMGDHFCYPKFTCVHLDFPGLFRLKFLTRTQRELL